MLYSLLRIDFLRDVINNCSFSTTLMQLKTRKIIITSIYSILFLTRSFCILLLQLEAKQQRKYRRKKELK